MAVDPLTPIRTRKDRLFGKYRGGATVGRRSNRAVRSVHT